uniref:Uncharacterized protein n=1 Tax=Rhizophora mucronata TaxID=61149 RepID=A0A2P2NVU6_RHIMU
MLMEVLVFLLPDNQRAPDLLLSKKKISNQK